MQFSARIKAENVSRKPLPYNGVKFMAAIVTDHEKTWPAAELDAGTFDWQKGRLPHRDPGRRPADQPGRRS